MQDEVLRILSALGGEVRTVDEVSVLSEVRKEDVARRLAELLHTGQVELFCHVEDGKPVQSYRLTARARLTHLGPSSSG